MRATKAAIQEKGKRKTIMRTIRLKTKTSLLLSALIASLAMSACGGGEEGPASSDPPTSPTNSQTPTGAPPTTGSGNTPAPDPTSDSNSARLNQPTKIESDSEGNLLVVDNAERSIRRIDTQGAVTTLLQDAAQPIEALAVSRSDNVLYYLQGSNLWKMPNAPGSAPEVIAPLSGARYLEAHDGSVYEASERDIYQVHPDGQRTLVHVTSRFISITAFAIDADGRLIYAGKDESTGRTTFSRVVTNAPPDCCGASPTPWEPVGPAVTADVVDLEFGSTGNLYFTDATGAIRTASEDGTSEIDALPHAGDLAVEGDAYVADSVDHVVYRVTPDGSRTVFVGKPGEAGTSD